MRFKDVAIWQMGFRPFFTGATLIAIASIAAWTLVWHGFLTLHFERVSPSQWHAHEMIYGYAMAVVAGFLLTAVRNWTGLMTASGAPLVALFAAWGGARLAMLAGTQFAPVACVLDLLFAAGLFFALGVPLLRARQRRQSGVLAKVFLMGLGNTAFYLGYFGVLERGIHWSLYGGLYLLIGLILTIGARVLPGFIERGIDTPVAIRNPPGLTIASMLLFLPFFVIELFAPNDVLAGFLAIGLAAVNGVRLALWHTAGLWRKPLLWGLYLAFAFIVVGFVLFALASFAETPRVFAIHALGIGGVGMATLSMMARVSLGHTGRDVRAPPSAIGWVLSLLAAAALARFALPLANTSYYAAAITAAQALWLFAFAVFALRYLPVLLQPRVDGQPG